MCKCTIYYLPGRQAYMRHLSLTKSGYQIQSAHFSDALISFSTEAKESQERINITYQIYYYKLCNDHPPSPAQRRVYEVILFMECGNTCLTAT